MLPPVTAVANSSIAFQDPRAAQDGAADTHVRPQGALPQAANGMEQNAAIAGRLNLLLLTGQERMSDNLAIMVNLLGSRLGMERADGESLSAYAGRLVQALGDLTPQMRQSIQRQLSQMFGGLQLRTLMEAFRNPVGPEAATLSIYLELYRVKDKDLAARTVVTSYRQNAGEARANGLTTPTPAVAGRIGAGASPAQAAALPIRTEQGTAPLPETAGEPQMAEGDAVDDPMAPVAKGRLFSMQDERSHKMLKLAAARALQATMSYGAEPASRNPAIEPTATQAPEASESAEAPRDRLPGRNAQTADEPASGRPPASRTAEASATGVRTLPDVEHAAAKDAPIEANRNDTEPRTERSAPLAARSTGTDGEAPRNAGDKTQTLFVLKGWQEEATRHAEPAMPTDLPAPEDILPDPARLLGSTAIGEDAAAYDPAALPVETEAREAEARETPADEVQSLLDHDAEVVEQLGEAAPDATSADRAAQDLASPRHDMPDAELAQLRQQVAGREGVPLPLVSYLFAADDMAEEKGLKHRFNQDYEGESGGQDADGSGEDASESDDETPDETPEQRDSTEAQEQDPVVAPVEGETPNDLYWRMAGWS